MLSLRKTFPLPHASMAQLVEQRIRNAQVMGSSPIGSSTEEPPQNVEFSMLSGGFLLSSKRKTLFASSGISLSARLCAATVDSIRSSAYIVGEPT